MWHQGSVFILQFVILFYGTPFNILQIKCNLKILLFLCLKLLSYCHNNSRIIFRIIIGRQNACISEHQSHRDDVNSLSINVLLPYDTKCKKSITDKSLRNSNIHQCESVLNETFMISKYMPPKVRNTHVSYQLKYNLIKFPFLLLYSLWPERDLLWSNILWHIWCLKLTNSRAILI